MFKKILLVVIGFIFVVTVIHLCFAERLTITTYYPSPYGIYSKLLAKMLGVGDTNGDGQFDNNDLPTTEGDILAKGYIRTKARFSYQDPNPPGTIYNGKNGTITIGTTIITVRGGIITDCSGAGCSLN